MRFLYVGELKIYATPQNVYPSTAVSEFVFEGKRYESYADATDHIHSDDIVISQLRDNSYIRRLMNCWNFHYDPKIISVISRKTNVVRFDGRNRSEAAEQASVAIVRAKEHEITDLNVKLAEMKRVNERLQSSLTSFQMEMSRPKMIPISRPISPDRDLFKVEPPTFATKLVQTESVHRPTFVNSYTSTDVTDCSSKSTQMELLQMDTGTQAYTAQQNAQVQTSDVQMIPFGIQCLLLSESNSAAPAPAPTPAIFVDVAIETNFHATYDSCSQTQTQTNDVGTATVITTIDTSAQTLPPLEEVATPSIGVNDAEVPVTSLTTPVLKYINDAEVQTSGPVPAIAPATASVETQTGSDVCGYGRDVCGYGQESVIDGELEHFFRNNCVAVDKDYTCVTEEVIIAKKDFCIQTDILSRKKESVRLPWIGV
jgi:hypothetical protein